MTLPLSFPLSAGGPIDGARLATYWAAQLSATPVRTKVMSLADAMASHVRAGDALYLGGSLARPNAAAFEIVRQLECKNPRLTLIAPALANQHAVLVHCGLVAKAITSLHGNTYPGPGPNPVFTEADRDGTVVFEDWSMLTLVLRLYAAATGAPFLPTSSLVGTDLGRDLADAGLVTFREDPFGSGECSAYVAPLHPDVTVVHSLMADAQGNAVFAPPSYDDVWAAFAARRAVIVTTERIVPTETIRRFAHLVRVPAAQVTAVCEAPFGSHPNQLPAELTPGVVGYADDYEFLADLRRACRAPATLDAWVKHWVLGVNDHDEYLDRLGDERLRSLCARTAADGWLDEMDQLDKRWADPPTAGETNAVLGARYLHEFVQREHLRTGLAGVGVSTLSVWLAAASLREAGIPFDLLAEGGMYGYVPLPLDPYLFNYRNLFTSTSLSNVQTILDVIAGGHDNRTVGVLGAAQVDASGAINTSRIGGRMLTGSGGGNDIASSAAAVVVVTSHERERLPERVDYITSPGHRVRAIVTDRAVLERAHGNEDFRLTAVIADGPASSVDELVTAAVQACGWNVHVAREVMLHPPVSGSELAAVRTYDPVGNFVG
jgi:acyl CoA:acetate/3-ketoacid CoA transferase alpha subunit